MKKGSEWDLIIKPSTGWFEIDFQAIWRYRDLLMLLVRRDFVALYKQTVLGPFWLFVQPLFTTLAFVLVFSNIARIGTDGIPAILFYLSGITLWSYFADCITKTSYTFINNVNIFGKVYFPRIVVPLSILISNLFKFSLQFLLFLSVWFYFLLNSDALHPHYALILLLP